MQEAYESELSRSRRDADGNPNWASDTACTVRWTERRRDERTQRTKNRGAGIPGTGNSKAKCIDDWALQWTGAVNRCNLHAHVPLPCRLSGGAQRHGNFARRLTRSLHRHAHGFTRPPWKALQR